MPEEHPLHILNFRANRAEIRRLIDIHGEVAGTGVGYKANVEVLNKSAIVLLVACWEAFVEDLAIAAFEALLSQASSPDAFPAKVLALSSEPLRTSQDAREVWRLAADGWKDVLRAHKTAVVAQLIGKLNTPRPKQVDEVFDRMVGLKSLSGTWRWKGMTNQKAVARLDRLVTLRGEIAHRVATSRSVRKEFATHHLEFVTRLSAISSNRVRDHLRAQLGEAPWVSYFYGETK